MIDPFKNDEQLYHDANDIERRMLDPHIAGAEHDQLARELREIRAYLDSRPTDAMTVRVRVMVQRP